MASARAPWNAESLARWPGVTIPIDDAGGRFVFDADAADRAAGFFPLFLTHHKGPCAGQPFTLLDWQRDLIVRPLFGWKRRDGLRRFRKVLLYVGKKNGKTQLVAGLANLLLFGDGEPGAEIMVAAADRDQAALLFNEARAMVEDAPDLAGRADVFRREIVHRALRASMKVISAEARTKHGPNLHGVIIDELHAQPDRELVETLEKGVAARRQPLIVYLTTAGDDLESIAYEEYQYARKLIAGVIVDDQVLPIVFEAPAEADWRAPATWRAANPSLGVTIPEEYLAGQVAQALNEPRKQNSFKQLHLNRWTQQHTVWIPIETWDACAAPVQAPDPAAGCVCFGGLDLSSKIDLTALVVAVQRPDSGSLPPPVDEAVPGSPPALALTYTVDLVPFFWLPEDTLAQRVQADRIPYDVWQSQGWLRVTPGNVVDYDAILDQVVTEISPHYQLVEIGYDPWNATQFAVQLQKRGFQLTEIRQGMQWLSEPSKLFEALVRSGRLRHGGHPVLRWNVSNLAVKTDANENIRPVKTMARHRIDGAVAAILALAPLLRHAPPPEPTYQMLVFGR